MTSGERMVRNPGKVRSYGIAPIRMLFAAGLMTKAVAQEIGVTTPVLRDSLARIWGVKPVAVTKLIPVLVDVKIPPSTVVWGEIQLWQVEAAMGKGMTSRQVAVELGINYQTLRDALLRMGIKLGRRVELVPTDDRPLVRQRRYRARKGGLTK